MAADGCVVVMYHYVRDTEKTEYPAINALPVADFERQLDVLQQEREILTYPQFEQLFAEGRSPGRPTALLTFDDGFIEHYDTVTPILARRGLSGVFFLVGATLTDRPLLLNVHKIHFLLARLGAAAFEAELRAQVSNLADSLNRGEWRGTYRYDRQADQAIKRFLNYDLPFDIADGVLEDMFTRHIGSSWDFARSLYLSHAMIGEMTRAGMTMGAQTELHRVLSRLSREQQEEELNPGVETIRRVSGQTSVPFCYPYGHPHAYNADTVEVLEAAGYAVGFNTVRTPVVFGSPKRFELGRFDTKDLPPFAVAPAQ